MAENFNIEIKTTAAYSPWSNGLTEQPNTYRDHNEGEDK